MESPSLWNRFPQGHRQKSESFYHQEIPQQLQIIAHARDNKPHRQDIGKTISCSYPYFALKWKTAAAVLGRTGYPVRRSLPAKCEPDVHRGRSLWIMNESASPHKKIRCVPNAVVTVAYCVQFSSQRGRKGTMTNCSDGFFFFFILRLFHFPPTSILVSSCAW